MLDQKTFENAGWEVRLADGGAVEGVRLVRDWDGSACRLSVVNESTDPVRIAEVAAFITDMPYPADTPFYGEGYNMLSQYKGTLGNFDKISSLTDAGHYKLPQQEGCSTVYNLLLLYPGGETVLLGFASCRRFSNELRFNPASLEVVVDCEGIELAAGETLELEEFFFASGTNREDLLEAFGRRIHANHPRPAYPGIPTGWCSWYCYGDTLTEQDIFDNLEAMKRDYAGLEFIQIDAGYQARMGDWLVPHPNFPSGIKSLCLRIREAGFEPALWVAPFIAEEQSDVLREHPEWFIQNDRGEPLNSADVTFRGWRWAPWYMLDGTHPGAQDYLRHVFRIMREDWQCRYFKLDANMWGALPFGRRHDPKATRVEAYRAGMRALREGAGEGSFILGCNAPMWPSIGTVDGMRTTGDISRKWQTFRKLAEEGFNRNWQNHHLWLNDPDCIVLRNLDTALIDTAGPPLCHSDRISEDEFSFHAAYILASGGMILASDRMMELNTAQQAVLQKLLPPGGVAARFDDRTFQVGRIEVDGKQLLLLFNWEETPVRVSIPLDDFHDVCDYWTNDILDRSDTKTPEMTLPPHSARVLVCV